MMAVFPLSAKLNNKSEIAFMQVHQLMLMVSGALIVGSLLLLFTRGLAFGIDFTGGIVIEVRSEPAIELSDLRQHMENADGLRDVSIQSMDTVADSMIRIGQPEGMSAEEVINQVKTSLTGEFSAHSLDFRRTDFVGPQVGRELIEAGAMSLGFAFLGILAYIWMRFEWQFSVGAIIALVHDIILMMGFYALLGLEFNLTSVAALLTIIGYSINDSVVIYDRVRENLRKYKSRPLAEILDRSVNDTLSRTILTAGTTLVALLALVLFGGPVLFGFSLTVLFGVVIGTYSSIFIAAPVLLYLKK